MTTPTETHKVWCMANDWNGSKPCNCATPTETPLTSALFASLPAYTQETLKFMPLCEQLEKKLTAATAQLASVLEDRARFPDKPDDVGRMIEAHMENLKALAARHEQNWRDKEIENCALKAQLEEAGRDGERMLWLENRGSIHVERQGHWNAFDHINGKHGRGPTVRSAIDAAMQQKEGK